MRYVYSKPRCVVTQNRGRITPLGWYVTTRLSSIVMNQISATSTVAHGGVSVARKESSELLRTVEMHDTQQHSAI